MLPRMSPRALASASLALCSLIAGSALTVACNNPASTSKAVPVAEAPPAPTPIPTPAEPAAKADDDATRVSLLPAHNSPRPAPEPPLTQEELDLLAADPATLTLEMRRKRGYALRRKILQNPDSPTARQLEALRLATERGEITPQLPNKSGDSGLVLHARTPSPAPPEAKAPAPKTPAAKTP